MLLLVIQFWHCRNQQKTMLHCKPLFLALLFYAAVHVYSKPVHNIQKRSLQNYLGDLFPAQAKVPENGGDLSDRLNCKTLKDRGYTKSGMYEIKPDPNKDEVFKVFCDVNLQGGGWIVIQRRVSDDENFNLDWDDYRNGFGKMHGDFWLGLESISRITLSGAFELYIGLQSYDTSGQFRNAWYNSFQVGGEVTHYTLTLGSYDSTKANAGDSFMNHNTNKFSTKDRDNDGGGLHCANIYQSGWWYYSACHNAHLNGVYYNSATSNSPGHGILWPAWKGNTESLKAVVMAIRPVMP